MSSVFPPERDRLKVDIDLVFDVTCPWCFIGKRRLEEAMRKRSCPGAHLTFRPFILYPDLPKDGVGWPDFLRMKFSDPRRIARTLGAITATAAGVGLDLRLDLVKRAPNTVNAHSLIRLGTPCVPQEKLVEAIFRAFFLDGRDIGDTQVLCDIGADHGLDPDLVRAHLDGDVDTKAVLAESARSHSLGMNGVPGFIFNGSIAISGAQETDVLVKMMDLATDLAPHRPLTHGAPVDFTK